MEDKTVVAGVLMDKNSSITFVEVCETCHISENDLIEMIEQGLLQQQAMVLKKMDQHALARIQSACRLQQDLGLNIPGVVLAMELLDELDQMREELLILQRHVIRG